ncbi:apiosidase-like domain-containing protein [Dyadobacter psychrotolerans]|uniref:DUF4038 domain-containing protein n=1 Tax=Dyadobacter psychrotolerans TaxID=2541721 RepID=A0A4R5DVQ9_9BACT|nr:DUF4038 domain-containing protein [Dyadobacter psychrotolerans]TDE18549.1 DUF4038 domain-containing protein [Dyadobacter psychrotolerans]
MKYKQILLRLSGAFFLLGIITSASGQTPIWTKFEKQFQSAKTYENPVYNLQRFHVRFESPSGRVKIINGFWDGDKTWKVRFSPDETGSWVYQSFCSDTLNTGLHHIEGTFECSEPNSTLAIYSKGHIVHPKGSYYLSHADGTPFFYTACTAWNGTLKSTAEEWSMYLDDRVKNHYNVIQFAATQWRGGDKNSEGQVAFEGSGRIKINPSYFKHLDKKIDEINKRGLVAAPVLLWALPVSTGRELSPGYYLPDQEAALLANYMVARYGANHVIWILGGDGKYTDENEQRWKNIGRSVFGGEHPGVVSLHSQGKSWIGKEYANEEWLDIIGYQTGHDNGANTANWITKGPVATDWMKLPPKVFINMEPCYEDISPAIKDKQVRNASYWSLFSTPVAGIAYGANGIWPWIRPGEEILNHRKPAFLRPWFESIKLPGSIQIGLLSDFIEKYNWWNLKPAPELNLSQVTRPEEFVSIVRSDGHRLVMAYVPVKTVLRLANSGGIKYSGSWFDPSNGESRIANVLYKKGTIEITSPSETDFILILQKN